MEWAAGYHGHHRLSFDISFLKGGHLSRQEYAVMTTRQHRRVRYLETDIYHKILFARKVITRCSVCCNRGVARAGNRGVSHTAYSGQEWSSQDALGAGCGLRATLAKSMLCVRHLSYRHARHLCYLERGADCVPLLVTLIKLLNQNNVYICICIHTYIHRERERDTHTHMYMYVCMHVCVCVCVCVYI